MATTLTADHPRAERRLIPDGMPLDELEREMLDFAQECEAAWFKMGLPQASITVRAWPNNRFIWAEAHEVTYRCQPIATADELRELIAEDYR